MLPLCNLYRIHILLLSYLVHSVSSHPLSFPMFPPLFMMFIECIKLLYSVPPLPFSSSLFYSLFIVLLLCLRLLMLLCRLSSLFFIPFPFRLCNSVCMYVSILSMFPFSSLSSSSVALIYFLSQYPCQCTFYSPFLFPYFISFCNHVSSLISTFFSPSYSQSWVVQQDLEDRTVSSSLFHLIL